MRNTHYRVTSLIRNTQPPRITVPRHRSTVGSYGGDVSYGRGTPVITPNLIYGSDSGIWSIFPPGAKMRSNKKGLLSDDRGISLITKKKLGPP